MDPRARARVYEVRNCRRGTAGLSVSRVRSFERQHSDECSSTRETGQTASTGRKPQKGTNLKEVLSGDEGRSATGRASQEDTKGGVSGRRTDSSQQRRAGARRLVVWGIRGSTWTGKLSDGSGNNCSTKGNSGRKGQIRMTRAVIREGRGVLVRGRRECRKIARAATNEWKREAGETLRVYDITGIREFHPRREMRRRNERGATGDRRVGRTGNVAVGDVTGSKRSVDSRLRPRSKRTLAKYSVVGRRTYLGGELATGAHGG